MQELEKNT